MLALTDCASGAYTKLTDLSIVPEPSEIPTEIEGIWRGTTKYYTYEYTFSGNSFLHAVRFNGSDDKFADSEASSGLRGYFTASDNKQVLYLLEGFDINAGNWVDRANVRFYFQQSIYDYYYK